MTAYNPPQSTAVVDIPDALADRYEAVGWTKVAKPKPVRKPRTVEGDGGDDK